LLGRKSRCLAQLPSPLIGRDSDLPERTASSYRKIGYAEDDVIRLGRRLIQD